MTTSDSNRFRNQHCLVSPAFTVRQRLQAGSDVPATLKFYTSLVSSHLSGECIAGWLWSHGPFTHSTTRFFSTPAAHYAQFHQTWQGTARFFLFPSFSFTLSQCDTSLPRGHLGRHGQFGPKACFRALWPYLSYWQRPCLGKGQMPPDIEGY